VLSILSSSYAVIVQLLKKFDVKYFLGLIIKYWRELLIIGLIIGFSIAIKNQRSYNNEMYQELIKIQGQEIEKIAEVHKQELKEREEAIARYQAQITKIEKDYQKKLKDLSKKKDKRVKEIVKKRTDKPEEVASIITNTFGFEHVE
jgi:hypothetical protein